MKWSSGSCRPAVGRRVQTSAVGCARQSGAVGCARQSGAAARQSGAAWRVGAEAWRVGAAAWRVGAAAWRVGAAAWRVGAAAWQSGRGSRALWSGRAFGCSPYRHLTDSESLISLTMSGGIRKTAWLSLASLSLGRGLWCLCLSKICLWVFWRFSSLASFSLMPGNGIRILD